MEGIVVIGFLLLIGLPIGAIMGMVALGRTSDLRRRVADLEREGAELRRRLGLGDSHTSMQPSPVAAATVPAPIAAVPGGDLRAETGPGVVRPPRSSLLVDLPTPRRAPAAVVVPPVPVPPAPAPTVAPAQAVAPVVTAGGPSSISQAAATPRRSPAPPSASPAAPTPLTSEPSDFEAVVGKRWLTWSGVALLFLGGVFLVKYAYDQDWLGRFITSPMRIGGIVLAAVVMLLSGLRFLRQGMTALGQGLAGGGIALAYLAVYGGFSPAIMLVPEAIIPGKLAFALMAGITALGMTLAVRANALPMAICAILGGFATPVLIDTGGGSREALFSYVLLLDLGVLGAAWYSRWRALDVLAFVGTVLLYAGWQQTRAAGQEPWGMLVWLMVFHQVFLVLPFAHHWRTRSTVTIERFVLALGNLAFTLGFAGLLLRDHHTSALALVCLGLAGVYAGIGGFTRARIGEDAKVVHGFLALGVMLLTLGLFYLLPVEAIATAWAAEAVALLALGYRFMHAPTRLIAHGVLALALVRLLVTRLPPDDLQAGLVANAWFVSLLVAPLALAAMAVVHRLSAHDAAGRTWQRVCWWLAGAALLVVGSAELARHAVGHPAAWVQVPVMSGHAVWWMLGGLGFLAAAWRWRCAVTARLALFPAILAVVCAFAAYAGAWPGGPAALNPRCVVAAATLAAVLTWWWSARRGDRLGETAALQAPLLVVVQLGTVLLATIETLAWYARSSAVGTGTDLHLTLTLVWLVAALIGMVIALASSLRLLAQVAVLPLALGVVSAFLLYARDGEAVTLAANARFLVVVFAVVLVWLQRVVLPVPRWWGSEVQALATLAAACEVLRWSHDHFSGDAAIVTGAWALALVLAGAGALGALRWRRGASSDAWWLGALCASSSAIPALATYLFAWDTELPFLNLRVLAPAAAVAALRLVAHHVVRRPLLDDPGKPVLLWCYTALVAFTACTVEAPAHFLHAINDQALAERVARFSITVVWVVLASGTLVAGFHLRQQAVRYVALGIFALTAAKLLLVDMSGVQQLYRILAFMLVGVVLIAASYAYHRLERRLEGTPPLPPVRQP
jgi:uncharacterized membrane protein